MPDTHYILFYDYVADILERRAPHRDAHLALIRAAKDDGRILLAGPLGDPPHGAAIVFKDRTAAEAFPESDPYVTNGLVTDWQVDPWAVVT
ncbi:MAG TPA: YciI family protein [Solirubrobacteraceae bacterium]|nr:YciI family protein [Solirubrobacteraceae bacterium]